MKIRTAAKDHLAGAIGVVIVLIAGLDVAVLVAIGIRHPRPNTLSYEAATACMQVLVVAVLGGVLSLASVIYQSGREDQRRRDQWGREDRQRADDLRRDARQRRNALVREFLRDVLSSYQTVKRARRVLQTWRWDPQQAGDLVELYDAQLAVINDAQLDFERLQRTAPTLGRSGVDVSRLQASFSTSERYLNRMLNEWRKHRQELVNSPATAEAARAKLKAFIDDIPSFRRGMADPVGDAIEELQNALIAPDERAAWAVGPPWS